MSTNKNEQFLAEIKSLLISQQDTVLPFKEACKHLSLSPSQLYKLTSQNKIPHSKPNGKKVYFSKLELDAWLMGKRVKTNSEIDQMATSKVVLKKRGVPCSI